MANLSEQDKVVKKYYEKMVENGGLMPEKKLKKVIRNFCIEFSKASLVGTKYADNKVVVKDNSNTTARGSMNVGDYKGDTATFEINASLIYKEVKSMFSKEKRFEGFYGLVQTANHEMTHFVQNRDAGQYKIQANMISLGDALDYSYESIARSINPDFYDGPEGNYYNTMKEGDARRNGCLQACRQITKVVPKLSKKQMEFMGNQIITSVERDNIEYNKINFADSDKKMTRSEVTRIYAQQAMADSPESLLEEFPALQFEFYPDGTRIPVEEVWNIMKKYEARITANNNIREDTRKEMLDNLNIGMSKIMYNNLRTYTQEEKEDLVFRIGKENAHKLVEYTLKGKELELNNRAEKIVEYAKLAKDTKIIDFLDKNKFLKAAEKYEQKAGFGEHWDFENQINFEGLDNDETRFLKSFQMDIHNIVPGRYKSESVKNMADEVIKEIRDDKVKENQRGFNINYEVGNEARARRKREQAAKVAQTQAKEMKRQKGIWGIFRRIFSKQKLLNPAPDSNSNHEYDEIALSERIEKSNTLGEIVQNSEFELENIKKEAGMLVKKVEARQYLDKDEQGLMQKQEIDTLNNEDLNR